MKCIPMVPPPELEPAEVLYYRIPGGKANRIAPKLWEDPVATAKRELREESGLKLKQRTPLVRVYSEVGPDGHTKYGFGVLRSECFGRLRKEPHADSSTRFVGHLWVPIDRALELIRPTEDNASQHNVLLATKTLIEGGRFGPCTS